MARVAYLDMRNTGEQCPSAWVEYVSGGIRACKRPDSPGASCPGKVYSINSHRYSKVCGRVIGYLFGSTDGFSIEGGITAHYTID